MQLNKVCMWKKLLLYLFFNFAYKYIKLTYFFHSRVFVRLVDLIRNVFQSKNRTCFLPVTRRISLLRCEQNKINYAETHCNKLNVMFLIKI